MAERRPWRARLLRRLPKRYRDMLPEPPAIIPPTSDAQIVDPLQSSCPPVSMPEEGTSTLQAASGGFRQACDHVCQLFTTHCNKFGLSRQYTTNTPPSHDPELNTTPEDLQNDIE